MLHFYEQYQRGSYQEVYDDLLAKQDQIYEPTLYEDASTVMRSMMQRVRMNIEMIIQRLPGVGYVHHTGLATPFASQQGKDSYEKEMPFFQLPTKDAQEQVALLDQLSGSLPLSLRFFYEEVGCVNFVGAFSSMESSDGWKLDPLFIFSLDIALKQALFMGKSWKEEPRLILSGDHFFKYEFGGGGTHDIALPCKAIDTIFDGEPHNMTFVNYLRMCLLKWGGFPGLEEHSILSKEQLIYLTQDLLPF